MTVKVLDIPHYTTIWGQLWSVFHHIAGTMKAAYRESELLIPRSSAVSRSPRIRREYRENVTHTCNVQRTIWSHPAGAHCHILLTNQILILFRRGCHWHYSGQIGHSWRMVGGNVEVWFCKSNQIFVIFINEIFFKGEHWKYVSALVAWGCLIM